jgi:tRNA G18 (ribose-2'-O)-methylase SpoU
MTGSRARRSARAQALERYRRQRRLNALAQPGVHELVVVLDHLKPNFNVAKILRSAQAFGVREVHLIGIGPFDPAPAKGAFKAVPVRFADDFSESHRQLAAEGYRISLLTPAGAEALPVSVLPRRSALVVGHEEHGFSFDPDAYPELARVRIPQYGPIESLNVSVAASIAMYEYARRHGADV